MGCALYEYSVIHIVVGVAYVRIVFTRGGFHRLLTYLYIYIYTSIGIMMAYHGVYDQDPAYAHISFMVLWAYNRHDFLVL